MSYFRVNENCNGCLACVENCPASALDYTDQDGRRTLKHNIMRCARCGQCWRVCPQRAIEFQYLMRGGWDEVVKLDLIHCAVCGEPLYSPAFRAKVESKAERKPDTVKEPLCPKHQQRKAASLWPSWAPGKAKSEQEVK